jgi:hypothetical protein
VLRHYIPIAFALAAIACEPSIPQTPPPAAINYAVFDLSAAKIPQPNDLTLQPSVIAGLPDNAQREFLSSLATSGGFPNDQELPVTIDLQRVNVAANGKVTLVAPTLDVASITSSNLVALQVDATNTPSVAQLEPVTASAYAVNGDHGTLTLFHKGHKPWPAGVRIIIALRGGGDGVTVQNGEMLQAAPNLYLLLQNSDLSQPQNTALLPGTRSQQLAEGAQLEQIRQQYQPIFKALDALFFPHTELASLTTFQIAPAKSAQVVTDPAAGIIPIPSDLLLDASGKHVQNIAAFGPLAGGIATLDGFSTTAPISAQTSGPVLAATITKDTVLLYDLSNPAAPVRVPDATQPGGNYVSEPPQVTQMVQGVSVSTLIALQPAVAVPGPNGALALPPLKEATEYAVIVTDGVKDVNQKGLSRSTLSSVLLFQHPIVDAAGKSQLQGIDDATAASLDRIRLMLKPALGQLKTDTGMDTSHVAIAYTFRTQSITGVGALSDPSKPVGLLQLAALPYADPVASANFVPTAPTSFTAAEAFANYGIDTTIVPLGNIAEVLEAKMPTVNLLSNATGAFDPTQSTHEIINVLMAIPQAANVPACPTGGPYPPGAKCAPLVVFHHGLGGSRGNMLEVADSLTAQGFVVAAIDSPKHGDRSWCSADNQCANGSKCVAIPGASTQGDATAPGICDMGLRKAPILCATPACLAAWSASTHQDGIALASSNYLVSGNLFRIRDTFRQDVIDHSALILALARPPQLPAVTSPINTHLGPSGVIIDPAQIFWEGQSLGSILGTLNVAANPRISRAALNVGGGTVVDVLTNAPNFTNTVGALLTSLNIKPGTAQYFQFILVAKWIMDPAEPVNFAGHLLGDAAHPTLPDLLQSTPHQVQKAILAQVAACDTVVPNAFNLELDQLIGLHPTSPTQSTLEVFVDPANAGGQCAFGIAATSPGTVPHGFLTDWGVSYDTMHTPMVDQNISALTQIAQDQDAAFLKDPTQLPPPEQLTPQ